VKISRQHLAAVIQRCRHVRERRIVELKHRAQPCGNEHSRLLALARLVDLTDPALCRCVQYGDRKRLSARCRAEACRISIFLVSQERDRGYRLPAGRAGGGGGGGGASACFAGDGSVCTSHRDAASEALACGIRPGSGANAFSTIRPVTLGESMIS